MKNNEALSTASRQPPIHYAEAASRPRRGSARAARHQPGADRQTRGECGITCGHRAWRKMMFEARREPFGHDVVIDHVRGGRNDRRRGADACRPAASAQGMLVGNGPEYGAGMMDCVAQCGVAHARGLASGRGLAPHPMAGGIGACRQMPRMAAAQQRDHGRRYHTGDATGYQRSAHGRFPGHRHGRRG